LGNSRGRALVDLLLHALARSARDRSHNSTTTVLIENPIQNAIPKNCLGSRCVNLLVAKSTPITGRVVSITQSALRPFGLFATVENKLPYGNPTFQR
jgi:hypothetical protein